MTTPVCRRRTSATIGASTVVSVAAFATLSWTVTSATSLPHFSVRRLGPSTTTVALPFDDDDDDHDDFHQHNNPRGLFDVILTLSQDGINTELPPLFLELQGTNGDELSVDALLTIEYAMADYLEDLLKPRWPDDDDDIAGVGVEYNDAEGSSFVPALTRVRTLVVNDQPLLEGGGSGGGNNRRVLQDTNDILGNTLELIATLTFRDQSPPTKDTTATVTTTDNTVESEIPDDDALLRQANGETAMSLPSNTNLDAAAGDAWNDLNVFFGDWLFPAIALDADPIVQQEFVNLTGVSSASPYPTSAPVEDGGDGAAEGTTTHATTEAPTADGGGNDSNNNTNNPGSNNNNTVAGINDATYLSQNDNGGIDPLYPAIAAGIAVFLCTIIVLGYRRQSRQMDHLIGNKAEPPIHVHDSTFLDDGEEEIEVEDHYFMKREKSMVGTQCGGGRRHNRDSGDYDPYNDNDDDEYDLEQDQRSDARSGSSRRNSYRGGGSYATEDACEPTAAEMEEFDVYATLNPQEKSAFLRYINQGLSVQQAQQQIFADRAHPSLTVNGSRSPQEARPTSRRTKSREQLQTEVMPDGKTIVHVPEDLTSHGLAGGGGGNSSRSIGHDGRIVSHGDGGDKNRGSRRYSRAMLISDASSSVGSSSFDDRDFLQNASSGALDAPSPSGEKGVNRSRFFLGGHRKKDRPQRGQVMALPESEI